MTRRAHECKDCRLPMTARNHYRTDGVCATCRKERDFVPPPEVAYEVGLCQSQFVEGPWPFFAPEGEQAGSTENKRRIAFAKSICALCPCRVECRAWALDQGSSLYGVWGGTTRGERQRQRKIRDKELEKVWRERYGEAV